MKLLLHRVEVIFSTKSDTDMLISTLLLQIGGEQ